MSVKSVTVRLPEDLHRAVKVRCAERGDSLEGVARAAFVAYLERDPSEPGSLLERSGVRPLGSGEVTRAEPDLLPATPSQAAAASPVPSAPLDAVSPDRGQGARLGKASFRPDPKKGK